MDFKYKFTSIVLVENSELYLENCINSIINQSISFKDELQIIMVVSDSVDYSLDIISKYKSKYPDNIIILKNKTNDISNSIGLAIDYIEGEYVNLFKANDYYDVNLLKRVYDFFKEKNELQVVFSPLLCFNNKDSFLNIPKKNLINSNKFYFSNIFLYSAFFNTSYFKSFIQNNELISYDEQYLLNCLLVYCDKIGILNQSKFYYRQRPKNSDDMVDKFNCIEKLNFFDSIINKSLNQFGDVPYFLQYSLLNEFKYFMKIESFNDIFDDENEKEFFLEKYYDILFYIDEEVIKNHDNLPKYIKSFLLYQKNCEFKIGVFNNDVCLMTGDYLINNLKNSILNIDIVELTKDALNFTVSMTSCCYPENLSIFSRVKNKSGREYIFQGKYCEYPTSPRKTKRIFDINWEFTYHCDFSIPLSIADEFQLSFIINYAENGEEIHFENSIKFREFAGLSEYGNYLVKNSKIILFKGKTFYCLNYSYIQMLKFEMKVLLRIFKNHDSFYLLAIFYRIFYIVSYPFLKNNRIWLFVDRDTMADDNAEFLYRYCLEQDDNIKKYFIIKKSSHDYNRLKKSYPNIIVFNSFKHKLLYMYAEKIMASQLSKRIINPFNYNNNSLFEGISSHDFCFLQHGVILHDLSSWIRKYSKNLYLFVTSAQKERDSIVNGYYNYDPERVQVLGLSRYDNLESKPEKQILFIPTWRRHLNSKEAIINSDYLLSINSFLNNEKLIKYAKNNGYQLVFRPHPDLWKFLDLFELNDNFRISEDAYQDLFKTSSIMITDFSSVAFDFAYLKKPIIYYQREQFNEFHYDKGYFDYETMGFGPISSNEDDLVARIMEYIDTDCEMEEKYKSRVNEFFKFNDKNNSKRVYDWLISH